MSSNYRELKKKWYAKLKNSGFEDIERNEDLLKRPSSVVFGDYRKIAFGIAKFEYYQMAARFLNEHDFKNNRERIIWEYHANGISIRNIVKLLKKVRIKTYRRAVWNIITRLRATMKDQYMVQDE